MSEGKAVAPDVTRHEVALPDGSLISIGWDQADGSYYAFVFGPDAAQPCGNQHAGLRGAHQRRDCRTDEPRELIGQMPHEFPTLEALLEPLGERADHISPALREQLRREPDRNT